MTSSRPTVGIVGLGYGRAHISAFQANGCEVVAVCQRNQATAKAVADAYGVPRVFERWEAMLEDVRPEIVVIATPPHLHLAIAGAAFAAGAHVLCEKPLAMSRAEARAMVDAAVRAGRIGMTGFNWRFAVAMQRFHAMVSEDAVGRVFHIGARWLGARWADEASAPTWRMDRAQAGVGAMGDMGVHVVDFIRWNFGEFTRVSARAGIAYGNRRAPGLNRPPDAEDFCTVVADLASGAQATLTVSRTAHGVNEHSLEAYGSRGAVSYRMLRDEPRWWAGELRAAGSGAMLQPVPVDPAPDVTDRDPMDVIGKALIAPLVARFLDAVRTGRSASPSLEDGLRAQAVLDAVVESSTQGGWVDVAH